MIRSAPMILKASSDFSNYRVTGPADEDDCGNRGSLGKQTNTQRIL